MQLEEFDIEFLASKMSENPRSMLFARLADLYLVKEQNAEAMKLLEEGIPEFPNYYAAYIVLGKAHLAFKEYSRAFTAFSKALELSPFNQTAAQLLTTVPNKPDESTRTTDENYFSPTAAVSIPEPASTPQSNPVPEFTPEPVIQEPVYEVPAQPAYTPPTAEEMGITQDVIDSYAAVSEEPAAQTTYAETEQQSYQPYQPLEENFPTYDEYFAQNQHRINTDTLIRLDDYLSGDAPEVTPIAPVIEEAMPSHEFINESYVEPEATPFTPAPETYTPETPSYTAPAAEEHFEPEPVFSSPEQAQLFAEMTGMDVPSTSSSSFTDLDSLTEKLQSAEKIVPEVNYQPKTPVPQESSDDQAYETDAVTPTLAEIYASQGEYRAAIQAYEILMFSQPAKGAEYQKRVRELTQLQMEKDGLI